MMFKITLLLCLILLSACGKNSASGTDQPIPPVTPAIDYKIFASPFGSPSGKGTLVSPLDIRTAISKAVSGDTVILRGGVYGLTLKITINSSGVAGKPIAIVAYSKDTERPVLDFSALSRNSSSAQGIDLGGSYWYFYGIDIQNAGDNGVIIRGNNNVIEFCTMSLNQDSGLQLSSGASNNLIKNCDSFFNMDLSQGNADGFACKMDVGSGNHFVGCRSYNNSDDGWDGYLRGSDDVSTLVENCWSFCNGYLKDKTLGAGDGNGFKTGGYDAGSPAAHNMTLTNCIASGNKANGFDRNSNIGNITIYNCSSHANGNDYGFPGGKDPNQRTGKIVKIKNSLTPGKTPTFSCTPLDITNNSWQNGLTCTATDFESLDISQLYLPRKSNGALPGITYLKLKSTSGLIDKGVNVGLPYLGIAPDLGAFELK